MGVWKDISRWTRVAAWSIHRSYQGRNHDSPVTAYKQFLKNRITHVPAKRASRGQTASRLREKGWETFPVAVASCPGGLWRRLGRLEVQARPDHSAVGVAGSAGAELSIEKERGQNCQRFVMKHQVDGLFLFIWRWSGSAASGKMAAQCVLCVCLLLNMWRGYKY